jgi:hypothetical protein
MGYCVDDGVDLGGRRIIKKVSGSPDPGIYRCLLFDMTEVKLRWSGSSFWTLSVPPMCMDGNVVSVSCSLI